MPDPEQVWLAPPDTLMLSENEAHVWLASLEQPEDVMLRLQHTLSPDERFRAAKFHFDRDRRHFMIAHGVLRTLLGRYLHMPPAQLQFAYNEYGKPLLDMPVPDKPLHFNLSHSHELALFAFSYAGPVGVDIEYMRAGVSAEQAARVSFSPREQALLLALPIDERRQAFYTCWTRKEAYIKGRGTGFSLEPHLFDVAFLPGEPVALLASREDPAEPARWTLCALEPGDDYAGALAVEAHGWSLYCYKWSSLQINHHL
ncbi:MAG TPA: 4'-phosphopantetheinyl transferase superfamily protein [Ktedonobacteraceae bacterium]